MEGIGEALLNSTFWKNNSWKVWHSNVYIYSIILENEHMVAERQHWINMTQTLKMSLWFNYCLYHKSFTNHLNLLLFARSKYLLYTHIHSFAIRFRLSLAHNIEIVSSLTSSKLCELKNDHQIGILLLFFCRLNWCTLSKCWWQIRLLRIDCITSFTSTRFDYSCVLSHK